MPSQLSAHLSCPAGSEAKSPSSLPLVLKRRSSTSEISISARQCGDASRYAFRSSIVAISNRVLKVTIWDCQCYLHLTFIVFVTVAVVLATYWNFQDFHGKTEILIAILTHAGWPPILWLSCALSCWVPISYSIWPPDCPPREELLERDPKTGIAYPKEETKYTHSGWSTWVHELHYSLVTLYTIGVFVVSFWI
jgi:hypothetical protein